MNPSSSSPGKRNWSSVALDDLHEEHRKLLKRASKNEITPVVSAQLCAAIRKKLERTLRLVEEHGVNATETEIIVGRHPLADVDFSFRNNETGPLVKVLLELKPRGYLLKWSGVFDDEGRITHMRVGLMIKNEEEKE